eukprot:CAMPEP_0117658398 /NCGR_PEP_ID=MMETSP0804-20121206/5843_1 /TAXON_ID=1074897 /ORGANISM="Tetraselmis astigmatica, Strain CCMP880" /LENGTH=394 /DNA_ID=CAMNT_0005464917 /DNA_START=286 /DNA_END=1470 /DNA_ORIENTATION=-
MISDSFAPRLLYIGRPVLNRRGASSAGSTTALARRACTTTIRRSSVLCCRAAVKSDERQREGLDQSEPHVPVLMEEVLGSFASVNLKVYMDGTLGAGGHAAALLRSHPEMETLIGIDQDPTALALADSKLRAKLTGGRTTDLRLVRSNFSEMQAVVEGLGGEPAARGIDGILLDLGMSSMQVDTAERGFSFLNNGPLDMRMDPDGSVTAEEIVNTWSERKLGGLFREYGEEKFWRQYASRVCVAREGAPITTTTQLCNAIGQPIFRGKGKGGKKGKPTHPATRVFQALRIAVNNELGVVEKVIPEAIQCLAHGGRLAIISFHSLEDRIVKKAFLAAAGRTPSELTGIEARLYLETEQPPPLVKLVTRKPLVASEVEMASNARSRSAKLRVVEKL